ncbi:MAG: TIGR04282 family arsenosugar biosynthesis glycosyltransferase [Thermodesulfobacteriota bacterium]
MPRMRTLLVIFAKEPVPGQVKTRLCPPLSPEAAAQLYHGFLEDILEEMGRVPQVDLALAFAPDTAAGFFKSLVPTEVFLTPQTGEDLGERLIRAFAWGFGLGFGVVLVRNSDSPDLPRELVIEAKGALAAGGAKVVLGPSPDGGYYLVGLRAPQPELFRSLAWSTATVLADTLNRAQELSLAVHLLPPWPDIDTYEDLAKFLARPLTPHAPGWRSHRWAKTRLSPDFP